MVATERLVKSRRVVCKQVGTGGSLSMTNRKEAGNLVRAAIIQRKTQS